MTKWVRWGGLLTFVVAATIVVVFWILFVDTIVERTIEQYGTDLVGAKVELDEAHLALRPVGLTLYRVQVTDPDDPMTNAIEIREVGFALDGLNLLRRKLLVERMMVAGVQLATPRATSGAIDGALERRASRRPGGGQQTEFGLPTLEIPDVQTILANEDLETLRLAQTLKQDIDQEKDSWQQRLKALPGKETFEEYEARVKKLKDATKGGIGGVLGGLAEVEALQNDIRRDIDAIENAQRDFKTQFASLKVRIDQIRQAPKNDLRRLREKYSLSPGGLANFSRALLGQQIGRWVQQAGRWYQRLKPLLQQPKESLADTTGPEVIKSIRGSGADVRFKEQDPLPDLLVRVVTVSLNLDAGEVSGVIENVTPDQDIVGKPLTFFFAGEKLRGMKTIDLKGSLNHVDPLKPENQINLRATGYEFANLELSKDSALPVTLRSGIADMVAEAHLRGEHMVVNIKGSLRSLKISAENMVSNNPLASAMRSAFTGATDLRLEADITGTLDNYDVAVRSDLDRLVKRATDRLVQDISKNFEQELSSAISKQTKGPIRNVKTSFAGLERIAADLRERLTQGQGVIGDLGQMGSGPSGPKGLPDSIKLPF